MIAGMTIVFVRGQSGGMGDNFGTCTGLSAMAGKLDACLAFKNGTIARLSSAAL